MTDVASQLNPRRFVADAPIELLVEALVGDSHPFGVVCDGDATRFICPRCGRVDHNGGTATVIGGWRWRCAHCRFTGTRIMLENLVLENADAIERIYSLAVEHEVGS